MNNRRVSPDKKERKCDPHEKRRSGDQSIRGERGFSSGGRRKEEETCFIGGRNSVLESLRAGQVKKVFIKPGKKDSRLLALAEEAERFGISVIEAEERELDRLTEGVRHQGVAASLKPYVYADLEEVLSSCGRKDPLLILLDGVEDVRNIGAIVRIAKIKDIKTMIYAFAEVRRLMPNTRLHIMGDVDDEEYYEECRTLIGQLDVKGIIFTGVVNVSEYIKKIDFVILTSISEGQPLSVLEAFAAGRACVTTDVGCCRGLLEGSDGFGNAGICVPPMNKEQLAQAMLELCSEPEKRRRMGEAGKRRVNMFYTHEVSMENYRDIYRKLLGG